MTLKCSKCGSENIGERTVPFEFVHNKKHLCISDVQTYCADCKNVSYIGSQITKHEISVADAIRKEEKLLSAHELKSIRLKYGLLQTDMEKILGLGPKTWNRWERGKVNPSKAADKLIRFIAKYPNFTRDLLSESGVQTEISKSFFENFEIEAKNNFKKSLEEKYSSPELSCLSDSLADDYLEAESKARTKIVGEEIAA